MAAFGELKAYFQAAVQGFELWGDTFGLMRHVSTTKIDETVIDLLQRQ